MLIDYGMSRCQWNGITVRAKGKLDKSLDLLMCTLDLYSMARESHRNETGPDTAQQALYKHLLKPVADSIREGMRRARVGSKDPWNIMRSRYTNSDGKLDNTLMDRGQGLKRHLHHLAYAHVCQGINVQLTTPDGVLKALAALSKSSRTE
jgi:hypothetical protein